MHDFSELQDAMQSEARIPAWLLFTMLIGVSYSTVVLLAIHLQLLSDGREGMVLGILPVPFGYVEIGLGLYGVAGIIGLFVCLLNGARRART